VDPSEYVYVGCADDHTPEDSFYEIRQDVLAAHGVPGGTIPWYDATQDGRPNYRCHHCGKHGSNIRYFVFFLHKPSKVVITVGQICAKKLNLGSREELDFQKRNEAYKRLARRRAWRDDHQVEYDFLQAYDKAHSEGGPYNEFFESLWAGLGKYGSLTPKQLNALGYRIEKWGEMTERQQRTQDSQRLFGQAPEATASVSATEKQINFIKLLMNERAITADQRTKADAMIERGISKATATEMITKLKTYPRIEQETEV
jgi:hypothetical protein